MSLSGLQEKKSCENGCKSWMLNDYSRYIFFEARFRRRFQGEGIFARIDASHELVAPKKSANAKHTKNV